VELDGGQKGTLDEYLGEFDGLAGDARTRVTFQETVKGIIGAGSLVCQRVAAQSAILSAAKDGGQRVSRFARGESTKRSQMKAEDITWALRERGIAHLTATDADEIWLVLDQSDLRKPYAQEMPKLMQVRDLDGKLVPGYRTVNVLGMTPGRRGILYHRLFSSEEEGFISESQETRQALQTTSQALQGVKATRKVSWIIDRGIDDVAMWRTIWEQGEHVVCRLKHKERLIEYQDKEGRWQQGDVERARGQVRELAVAETELVVRRGRQKRAKRQRIPVQIGACPVRLRYETHVRREGVGERVEKDLWLVRVCLPNTDHAPWLLITDWPVTDAESAIRIFQMYRQRWAVEDSFRFVKDTLGWEEVQLLNLDGIRTMLALGWVAAGFLYELGVTLEWEEVKLLARLGGWVEKIGNKPGKTVMTRGLGRILDMLVTQSYLDRYRAEHGSLPPRVASLIRSFPSGEL
jgi:hypothetical protein